MAGIEDNIERQKQSLARYQQEAAALGANIALPELVEGMAEAAIEEVVEEEPLEYAAEEQAWYPAGIPLFDEVTPEQLERFQIEVDVVLMVATEVELWATLHRLQPYPRRKRVLRAYVRAETYYLGKFGAYRTAVTRCGMGSGGERGSTLAAPEAIRTWQPRAIIMPGIAFGKSPAKQKMADVLVASQIVPYEKQRLGQHTNFRDPIPPSNAALQNRFENALDWRFERPDGEPCALLIGPILSGDKLVDDPEFKAFLISNFPEAIGGEMEGAGLAAAAGRSSVPWILVKAICDWGDGKKHGKHQPLAAAAAVSLVHHILSQKNVLPRKQ
jgi:nucleoside phosphorylase